MIEYKIENHFKLYLTNVEIVVKNRIEQNKISGRDESSICVSRLCWNDFEFGGKYKNPYNAKKK